MTSNIVTIPASSTVDVTIQFNELPGYGVWPIRYWVKADPAGESSFTITDHSVFGGYLTIEGESNSQSDYLCMDYQDEDGNLWQIGFDFNDPSNDEWFYDPQNTFKNIKYYKNGNRAFPSPSELQILLNRVAHKFSIFYPHIDIGELFDTDYGIWRQPCGFSWACNFALIDFDDNERKVIYKDLIWDAITGRNHPFLNAEYKVPDKTPYVSSALPLKISSFIDDLWARYSGAIGTGVQVLDRMKKVLLIAEKAQQDQALADEIKAESKQLDKTVSMLQQVGRIGDISLHTIQNIVLMDFLASTGFAENRLSTLKEAYNYLQVNIEGQIDPVLSEAINEVESELESNLESMGNLIVSSFLEATIGNLDDPNYVKQKLISMAAGSKFGKKLVGSVAKNLKLSKEAVATAVMDAISGLTTVMDIGDDWRRIILSGMLSKTVLLYAKNDATWHAAAYPQDGLLTYSELQKHQIRDVFDLQSVFAFEYLSRGLALVESDWTSVLQDALDSTLDQATSPPYAYPINYASTAVVFGQQVGIGANNLVYSDSLNAARDMLISIIDEAEKKNETINQWAVMMANSQRKAMPWIPLLLLDY